METRTELPKNNDSLSSIERPHHPSNGSDAAFHINKDLHSKTISDDPTAFTVYVVATDSTFLVYISIHDVRINRAYRIFFPAFVRISNIELIGGRAVIKYEASAVLDSERKKYYWSETEIDHLDLMVFAATPTLLCLTIDRTQIGNFHAVAQSLKASARTVGDDPIPLPVPIPGLKVRILVDPQSSTTANIIFPYIPPGLNYSFSIPAQKAGLLQKLRLIAGTAKVVRDNTVIIDDKNIECTLSGPAKDLLVTASRNTRFLVTVSSGDISTLGHGWEEPVIENHPSGGPTTL